MTIPIHSEGGDRFEDFSLAHRLARRSAPRIRHGLAAFPDEPHRLRLELPRERPPLPFGHDTLLLHFRTIWGVHERIGVAARNSPPTCERTDHVSNASGQITCQRQE